MEEEEKVAQKEEKPMTTYLIEFKNGKRQRITVPSNWKVTFGPAAKGKNSDSGSSLKMPLALRFYENETRQRAIFTDVDSFRDMSIKIQEEKITTKEEMGYVEMKGARKSVVMQAKVKDWIDPDSDEVNEDAKKLIGDSSMMLVDE